MTAPSTGATCYRHPDRPTNTSCTRCGNPICPEDMTPAAVGFQCPACVRAGRSSSRRPTGAFGGRVASGTPVTTALIAVNVLVYLATFTPSAVASVTTETSRFYRLVFSGDAVAVDHQYYRLVTAMFLHLTLFHIASNMLVLYFVGPQLERVLGWWRYLTCYLVAGLGGSVATYLFTDPRSLSAGASGAIFGLFAVLFVVARHLQADIRGIVATVVLNLVLTFSVPGISITAHLGGLVTGAVLGLLMTRVGRRPQALVPGIVGVLAVLVVLTLARTAALT